MKVFLSWSGERSHRVARALKRHVESISSNVEAWEADDLRPGAEWARSLIPNIERADVAVLCLTRRNLSAPWISFELGAFYRSEVERAAVPYLLDVSRESLDFPVGMFQAVEADRSGTKKLFWRVAEGLGIEEQSFEDIFGSRIWPNLAEELDEIRRVDEDGQWVNIANAFYLGHDLRWVMAHLDSGAPLDDIKHGLRQIVHQANELGLAASNEFKLLAARVSPILALEAADWDESAAADLRDAIDASFREFGRLIAARQPGYTPYPPDNQDEWLRVKARREA